jgi:multicomponent Na+:H+ antiporter subunit A
MIVALAACALVGFGLVAFGGRLHRRAFVVAAVPLAATAVWVATRLGAVTSGRPVTEHVGWVGGLDLSVDLRLDGLAATMSLVISVIGVAVLVYAVRYFAPGSQDLGRLAGLLVLFGGSMLGLVQADHVLVLYTCWELTSITSFLLIGNRHTESRARAAALHALLVTSAGGLAMLAGLLLVAREAGTYRLSEVVGDPPGDSTTMTVALILLLAGAFTKSAQYPFHAWLPGAMAAPTPVSAYLHSATMVKAGVFLVARLAPAFAATGVWRPLVISVGCCTLVFGGLRALRQHDLKLLLAFGTVSQLGLLIVLFGAGTPETATAGWALLVAHAAFKATLFMVVGILDEQTGTRDIRRLPALRDGWRPLEIVTVLALVSMAGLPLGAGFVAKELAYEATGEATFPGAGVMLAVEVGGSMLTVAYAARFYLGAFAGPRRRRAPGPNPDPGPAPAPPSLGFVAPAGLLAIAGVVLGIFPGIEDRLASASLAGFGADVRAVHLALWHGFEVPLALSALTVAGGAALVAGDRWVQPRLAWGGRIPSGAEVYRSLLHGLGVVSARVTGAVQSGSLPVYAGVILATAALVPGAALLAGRAWDGWPALGSVREAPVAIVLLVGALGAAIVRRRFAAALFLSVAGYAMAGLFVLSGAPDLALTQVAVETLSTVVFVLVLRRLPERFERQSSPTRRVLRLSVAAAVGASVFVFALVAAGHRLTPPVSEEMVERSVPDGHGRNVVNVILVDFRGLDTMGEITVLAVASIGAVALARVGRRAAAAEGRPERTGNGEAVRRLAFVDVSVRVVFHVVLMMSLWLLFAGHNQPGGGFVGGLLAGSAITLRYIAGGIDEMRARSRFRPWTVLGTGLLAAATTATVPLLAGGSVLETVRASLDLPAIGHMSVSSSLVFDVGVYLAVVGMVLMAFEAFGDDPAEATS